MPAEFEVALLALELGLGLALRLGLALELGLALQPGLALPLGLALLLELPYQRVIFSNSIEPGHLASGQSYP